MKKKLFFPTICLLLTVAILSCKSKSETLPGENDTVLVQLHNLEATDSLVKAFEEYQLVENRLVSRPMQIVLFSFNSRKIKDTTLIRMLKSSKLVKEAQQNRDVQLRN